MHRRRFSREFNREAVELSQQPGVTHAQIARDLGISAALLGRWARVLRESGEQVFPGKEIARDADIATVKRELARVKKERQFLREAATFFAREPK